MEIENGRSVRIRYICKLQDGKPYRTGEKDTLQFKVGAGMVPAALEAALMGLAPGDHRTIRLPASEVSKFLFPKESTHVETPPGMAYDFGPGEGGDVAEYIPAGKHLHEPPSAGTDLDVDVEILAVE